MLGLRVAVQFEHATPLGLPIGVEVDDQVQAAVRVRYRMAIEIDVRVKTLAVAIVMRASTEIVRVVQQVGYRGYPGYQAKEVLGLDQRSKGYLEESSTDRVTRILDDVGWPATWRALTTTAGSFSASRAPTAAF